MKIKIFLILLILSTVSLLMPSKILAIDYSFKTYLAGGNVYPTVSDVSASYPGSIRVSAKIEDVSGVWLAYAKVCKTTCGNQENTVVTLPMSFESGYYKATSDLALAPANYVVDIYVHDWLINDHWYQNAASFSVLRSEKAITAFNFNALSPAVTGTITENTHTIALTVPYATNVTALVPIITVSAGATVSPASGVARNFTTPQTYTVTAEDGTTQIYTVTVTVISLTPTQVDLSITPQPVEYGKSFSISAVLKDSDTGTALANKTIDFYLRDLDYLETEKIATKSTGSSGEPATVTISDTSEYRLGGDYAIIAEYAGDSEYLTSNDEESFSLAGHSGITFYLSSDTAKPGDKITLTANLYCVESGNTAINGSVKFYFDNNLISTVATSYGQAKFDYTLPSNTTIANHTLYAKYDGGAVYTDALGYITVLPSESSKKTLSVYNPIIVTASASANPTFLNPTSVVTFSSSASGGTGTYSYNWTGDCAGTSATCVKTVSTAKSYTATVTVTSGGQVSKSATVTVIPRLIVSATASSTSVVIGQPVTFSAVVSDTTGTYRWVLNNGASCSNGNTSQICTASFSALGSYNATVTVTLGAQTVSATSPDVTVVWTCGNNITDTRDGKSYKTVLIGSQCWMAENLNVGTFSTLSDQGISCSLINKYCYSNTESYCNTTIGSYGTYGAYYQWDQAMCGSTTAGAQGICPSGWHIPTDAEQYVLENYLKDSGQACSATRINASSCSTAGTKLKPLGSTGFNDLLLGYKTTSSFNYMYTYGYLWSSTQSGTSAWYRRVSDGYSSVYRNKVSKNYALPVRCVKD
jgi:uncharacterized protein (TIGR02145 family)